VEGLSEATDVDVALENPGGFVKLGDTKKVTVHVAIEPVIVERTFDNLTINLINVPSHLEAALSVDTLSLTVQGAQSAIEKYTPSGFVFFANCQGVTSSGVQEIPLTTMIPESFTVSASVPKTVQVRFTERALQQTEPASDTSGEKSE
jgi:hypothetical protein